MTRCAVGAGVLLGHHGHEADATLVAIVGAFARCAKPARYVESVPTGASVPVCEEHAVEFAESHDRCLRSEYRREEYAPYLRLAPINGGNHE